MAVDAPICAQCGGHGARVCGGCRLVLYCSGDCQKAHWQEHKQYCRSPLIRSDWEPDWVKENREPTFVGAGNVFGLAQFGGKKYFWGNVPAFDIVQLSDNEGVDYDADLNLLFAASGDPRNVIKSLASLPITYRRTVTTVINDLDFEIVARNTIILLTALTSTVGAEATRAIIHIWYSAFIQEADAKRLRERVRPLIEDVVNKIAPKSPSVLCGKTWSFGVHTLRLELTKAQWSLLLAYFDTPNGVTVRQAQEAREKIVLAPRRKDYRERRLLCQPPHHRIVDRRYREDGVLAPFGHSRSTFTMPNPTFFQGPEWPMKDSADPIEGWSLPEVASGKAHGASNDLYGKLYFHLQTLLDHFLKRLLQSSCHFRMLNANAAELPSRLTGLSFARIETSNISDVGYLGVGRTVGSLAPLLQSPTENPHATLVTLFINAVHEVDTFSPHPRAYKADLQKVAEYMKPYFKNGLTSLPTSLYSPVTIKMTMAKELVRDMDLYFDKYVKQQQFGLVEQTCGVEMKQRHTIIEKWPLRLKLCPGQGGAFEEFDTLLGSSHTGNERYVEWKRKV